MLKGTKPLAMFVDGKGLFPEAVRRYLRLFDRHVTAGLFVRRDHYFHKSGAPHTFQRILFALPSEAWRIDAMIALKANDCWNLESERREGELLGYDDWMNDHWIDRLIRSSKEG
jgi:hypothetical protein